jgi:alkanesulfonate monooxygenase SsuD/methylene tetrahydromethanopterin reductase-like flavin-dependent oxidoreductase (luciferase family)
MNALDDIQFYVFNHHHYAHLPQAIDDYSSSWVDYPNREFDPRLGHELYQRYTREIRLVEELGFDAIAINEHHNTAYSMQPSPTVRAGHVIASTEKIKILVAGIPLNLSMPNRVAEEYAMLDVMSAGRMEFGFPLGTGMEYWSNAAQINPTTARARFREGLEVLLQAWEQDGPTTYEGEHFFYRFLNPWPRPFQKPRPKIYIVGSGSPETVDLAVEYGAGYSVVFSPIPSQLRAFASLRAKCAAVGRTLAPEDLLVTTIVYVADTDEEAEREGRPYIERFFSWYHRVQPKYLSPPGYVSRDNFLRLATSAALAEAKESTWEDMLSIGRIACGSPDTVADTISTWAEEAQTSRVIVTLTIADMPEDKAVKNMKKFATEVIPRIRARAGAAK